MKRQIDIIDALTDAETFPDCFIDHLIDNYAEAMKQEYTVYFDDDGESDTPPSEIAALLAIDVVRCIDLMPEYDARQVYQLAYDAILENEQRWQLSVAPDKRRGLRYDGDD